MELESLIGAHLMFGISGSTVSSEMIGHLEETHATGIIIFKPNFENAEAFKHLLTRLETSLGRRLIVAVDHEGGRVIHLSEGVTFFPDNLTLGQTQNESFARRQGGIEAEELRRLGIDLNLAPTLDVLTENYSPNIGIRSYGTDPDLAARLGTARIQAMQESGLSACAKHFPGLGQSTVDPHLGLPVIETSFAEARRVHLKPFAAAIRSGVDCVMTSHPVYPNLDPKRIPVTFSSRIASELLRKELGFDGVLFSDDLEMGALKNICPIGEAAVRAVEAGHDMILVCHDLKAQKEVYRAILKAYRENRLSEKRLEESLRRVRSLRDRRKERFAKWAALPSEEGKKLAAEIAKKGISVGGNVKLIPIPEALRKKNISVIFPTLSSLSHLIAIEKSELNETAYLRAQAAKYGANFEPHLLPLQPTEMEAEQCTAQAARNPLVLFFCYDAHLCRPLEKILERIQKLSQNAIVVLLRDPFDREWVHEPAAWITAYGFRTAQLDAIFKKLFS